MNVKKQWRPGRASLTHDLSGQTPANGVVASADAWAQLWNAWRDDEVPNVDFKKDLILVAAGGGPNTIIVQELQLDQQGDLRFRWAITERGGPGFAATMLQVNRQGIKTVNGSPLPTN
jgi:hypothetical protein